MTRIYKTDLIKKNSIFSIDKFKGIFNSVFVKYLQNYKGELKKPIIGIVNAGGKRLRPYIVYLCALHKDSTLNETILLCGCIPELIHTASLIHDDIIDNAKLRRGLSTIHLKWNTKIAVLSGDFIFNFVLKIIGKIQHIIPSLIDEVVNTIEDMIEGQVKEDKVKHSNLIPELEVLRDINALKTGSLFSLSFYLGTSLQTDNIELLDQAKKAGEIFGQVFQVYDDLIDIFWGGNLIQKDFLNDIAEGKITIPYAITCEKDSTFQGLLNYYKDNPNPDLIDRIRKKIIAYSADFILSEIKQSVLDFKKITEKMYPYSYMNLSFLIDDLSHKIEKILN